MPKDLFRSHAVVISPSTLGCRLTQRRCELLTISGDRCARTALRPRQGFHQQRRTLANSQNLVTWPLSLFVTVLLLCQCTAQMRANAHGERFPSQRYGNTSYLGYLSECVAKALRAPTRRQPSCSIRLSPGTYDVVRHSVSNVATCCNLRRFTGFFFGHELK